MSDGMRRELAYLSSHATNRYFIPNWGIFVHFYALFATFWLYPYPFSINKKTPAAFTAGASTVLRLMEIPNVFTTEPGSLL